MRILNLVQPPVILTSLYRFICPRYLQRPSSRRAMSSRTYQDAVQHLNSLQSNAATLDAVRASGGRLSEFAIPEMVEYLERIGYTPEQLNALQVIHITGTKGKGSTSAFTDSIIRHAQPDWKVGLYTSPHLVAVRERIRVNGTPISEEAFAKYFFDVWDKLKQNTVRKMESTSAMPGYFRFLTLVAFHTFLELKVNATILEVGVGGTYDSTNIVPKPVVTGITALGIDHVNILGKTLQEIAWQKGGIFKEGVPAFTVSQPETAMPVLEQRAKELKSSEFNVVSAIPGLSDIKLGLSGTHQLQNANIAVYLARSFLQSRASLPENGLLPISFIDGLENTKWPGRCQTVTDPKAPMLTWYLDGAHTLESLECCMRWFVSPDVGLKAIKPTRVLVFNCTSGRSGPSFLKHIHESLVAQLDSHGGQQAADCFFDHVLFCANVTYTDGHFKGDLTAISIPPDDLAELKTQHQLASAWSALIPSFPSSHIHVLPSIEHAVKEVRAISHSVDSTVQVLVAGSLHLVGGLIEVADLSDLAL